MVGTEGGLNENWITLHLIIRKTLWLVLLKTVLKSKSSGMKLPISVLLLVYIYMIVETSKSRAMDTVDACGCLGTQKRDAVLSKFNINVATPTATRSQHYV